MITYILSKISCLVLILLSSYKVTCGMWDLSESVQAQIRSLSIPELETLGEALLDFQDLVDLENWLKENNLSN